MPNPTYVTKTLAAASSTGIGTFSSAATSVTFNTSNLDTARRIIVWGSSSLGATVTLTGTSETGTPISETVVSSTTPGGSVSSLQDFKSITAVSVSCGVTSTAGYLGTSTQGGTPWQVADITQRNPPEFGLVFDPTSTSITATWEVTRDYPSWSNGSWQNPNTTYGPLPFAASAGVTNVSSRSLITLANLPIAAWRFTIASTSSAAGTFNGTVIQQGI